MTDKVSLDLETIVGNPISPRGITGVTIDPGIVYTAGAVVGGGRIGWDIGAPTHFKLIPLIHRAVANVGAGANWFVEAASPGTFGFPAERFDDRRPAGNTVRGTGRACGFLSRLPLS